MIEVGRLCFKIAGREAGKLAVIIDVLDKNYVIVDGLVRRKKCNTAHLVPLGTVLKIKKNALTAEVQKAMIDSKIISEVPKKGEKKAKKEKPVKQHMVKEKVAKEAKPIKKEEAKAEKKEEKKEEKKPKPKSKNKAKKESKPKSKNKAKKESKPKSKNKAEKK
jgi:large subunit ribosomal protein L14e